MKHDTFSHKTERAISSIFRILSLYISKLFCQCCAFCQPLRSAFQCLPDIIAYFFLGFPSRRIHRYKLQLLPVTSTPSDISGET